MSMKQRLLIIAAVTLGKILRHTIGDWSLILAGIIVVAILISAFWPKRK